MHQLFVSCVVLAQLLGSVVAAPSRNRATIHPEDVEDDEQTRLLEMQAEGRDAIREYLVDRPSGGCDAENLSIRKEW